MTCKTTTPPAYKRGTVHSTHKLCTSRLFRLNYINNPTCFLASFVLLNFVFGVQCTPGLLCLSKNTPYKRLSGERSLTAGAGLKRLLAILCIKQTTRTWLKQPVPLKIKVKK